MARLLYVEISALTNRTGYCYAANAYFMRLFRITERTLQGHLRTLKERGYIRIENGDGGAGRRRIYGGINPLLGNPAKNCGVPDNPAENCGVTPQKIAGSTIEQDNITIPPKAPQGAGRASGSDSSGLTAGGNRSPQGAERDIWDPEAFERFWQAYPKKKDKQKAIREWNRLKADRKLMKTMSAALRRQKASEEWQRDNGRAIPYPCRWLSHRRWEDEDVTPAAQPSEPRREAELWI